MARLARLSVAAQLHLVVQRGNHGRTLFADDADREAYLDMLGTAAAAAGVALHAYALLDTRVHLLATPSTDQGLSLAMQSLGRRYVSAYNRRHGQSGTLWDGRFRAAVVEAAGFVECLVYVEQAPQREGGEADGRWSSRAHHLGQRRDPLVAEHPAFWTLGNTPFEREAAYRRRLEAGLSSGELARLADAQAKGWALGSAAFVDALALTAGRRAAPLPRGRPRKLA